MKRFGEIPRETSTNLTESDVHKYLFLSTIYFVNIDIYIIRWNDI